MADLDFEIVNWLAPPQSAAQDDAEAATLGALRITVGPDRLPVTEVEDDLARTVRAHIHVPMSVLAEWLLANWWRLRWEARPRGVPAADFRRAHCLAAAGGGNAWPALDFNSDGEFIYLRLDAEPVRDAAAIRFLRNIDVGVAAADFERAVDHFVASIDGRLAQLAPGYRFLSELRAELAAERTSPRLAEECRWQARAGIDPGAASDEWLTAARDLVDEAGVRAGPEVLSMLPRFDGQVQPAKDAVEHMKRSSTTLDLTWVKPPTVSAPGELPWQRGARLAQELRTRHALGKGPLSDQRLGELVHAPLPLPGVVNPQVVAGGVRNGIAGGRTHVVGWGKRIESQRFFIARAIGAAASLGADEHVLPILDSDSAMQKLERSFAQELLCPWSDLDVFTDEHGLDDDDIADAAEHFRVSEWTVRSALVNRGKLSRDALPRRYTTLA